MLDFYWCSAHNAAIVNGRTAKSGQPDQDRSSPWPPPRISKIFRISPRSSSRRLLRLLAVAKGLQDLAAELTDYSKKAFEAGSATSRSFSAPAALRGRDPNSVRLRQAGVRGLRCAGEQGFRALRESRLGRPEARHLGLRDPAGQVTARRAARQFPRQPLRYHRITPAPFRDVGFVRLPRFDSAASAGEPLALSLLPLCWNEACSCAFMLNGHLRVTHKFAMLSSSVALAGLSSESSHTKSPGSRLL